MVQKKRTYHIKFAKFHEKVLAVLRTWRSRSVRVVCTVKY